MSVWPVIGHEWAVDLLSRSVESERTSHAYLIVGPPKVGKTTLARAFAQMLFCRQDGRPCGRCRACRLVQRDRHPDVLVVSPVEGPIKIEAIRALQHSLSLSPVEGDRRLCVITNVDMATPSAANSLLKTLEEPPARVILVLTAARVDALLPTLVSRCQVLSLRPVPQGEIVSAVQARGVTEEDAQLIARLAQGRVGWALDLARDQDALLRRSETLEALMGLAKESYTRRFAWAQDLSKRPEEIPYVLDILTSWWRDVMLVAAGSNVPIANVDRREQLAQWAGRYGVVDAQNMLCSLRDTAWRLDHNANVRLALEVLALDMPGRRRNGS